MNRNTHETLRLTTFFCLAVAPLGATAATMSVSVAGEVNRVGRQAPADFPVENGDDFELSIEVDPSAPDLDPSDEGLYALDSFHLTLGDFEYRTTAGVGLKVEEAGSGNYRIEFVLNAGSLPELGTPAAPPTVSGFTLKIPDGEFLRIFLPGFPFTSDALPLDELRASAGSLASGNFSAWFLDGDERVDVRFRPGTLATTIPEPASLALLGLGGVALLTRRRRGVDRGIPQSDPDFLLAPIRPTRLGTRKACTPSTRGRPNDDGSQDPARRALGVEPWPRLARSSRLRPTHHNAD